jgi:hypothetical protein
MEQSYGHCRIFLPTFLRLDFPKYGRILGKTLWWRPQAPARQACPWGHSPCSSAPCAVPMRLSRIGQHIKDEPCAKQRALLGGFIQPFLKRFSRYPIYVPNLEQHTFSILMGIPLVPRGILLELCIDMCT